MELKNKHHPILLHFLKFCGCLLVICSLVLTPMGVNAAEQKEKDKWQVNVNNITKNVGETVTKPEVISAVTTTAMGKTPVKRTLAKDYEARFPFTIPTDGYYSFPVQVIYNDGSITEVVVKVVTAYDTTPTAEEEKNEEEMHAAEWEKVATNALVNEEKVALANSLETLLDLIQENPNVSTYTEETVNKYVQAQKNAYEPYQSAFKLLKKADLTLDELQKEHQNVKKSIQNIESAKKGLVLKGLVLDEAPVITATDKAITVGDAFDPKVDVTASDTEDGNITTNIEVVKNEVDTTKAGTY